MNKVGVEFHSSFLLKICDCSFLQFSNLVIIIFVKLVQEVIPQTQHLFDFILEENMLKLFQCDINSFL